jgi:putative membrane protein insertion efficiency factor
MPALRKLLRRPHSWLLAVLALYALVVLDAHRAPDRQVTAGLYVTAVHAYQRLGRPLLVRRVRCRYQPTCSEYSVAAVERYGIVRGMVLTVARVRSCTRQVPMGTYDPVR